MSGKSTKAMRRLAKLYVQEKLTPICEDFFNSMCVLPFRRRVVLAGRILFRRKLNKGAVRGNVSRPE
jgi:hypothetical protein